MKRYDAIVIGAGTNGLTAAAYLAKNGRRVLVVERRPVVGGLAAADEFHPGYRSAGLLHDTSRLRPWIVEGLSLPSHGLRLRETRPGVLFAAGGESLWLPGSTEDAVREIAGRAPADAERYAEYRATLDRIGRPIVEFVDSPPLDLLRPETMNPFVLLRRALSLRRIGRSDLMELLRLPPMCVADWLDEWFDDDLLKAGLALQAVSGSYLGPRSPGSNANLLLQETTCGADVLGGGPALVDALERAARGSGVEIRTGTPVHGILIDGGGASGVRLDDDEEIHGKLVAASCDPGRSLLALLPRAAVTARLERNLRRFRCRGTTAQLLLAIDGIPEFAAGNGSKFEFVRVAGDMTEIERAFDAVKYGRCSEQPVLEIHVPGSDGFAPEGHAVVSVLAHFAPRALREGWNEESATRLGDRILGRVEEVAPGISARIVAREIRSPADLEEIYGLPGGQLHHGEQSLDQLLVRPSPECSRYATPIPGLFLCGSGSHPGGGLTCGPGGLAAQAMLSASSRTKARS